FRSIWSLLLPAFTLGLGLGAVLARLLRAALIEQFSAHYMRTVMAKGGNARRQLMHAFRNALTPVVVVFFLQAGMVLTGTVLVEAVFSWAGVGSLLVEAIHSRDYPVVQGCVLFIGFVYMLANACADMLALHLDPRIADKTELEEV
ncbi:MAG: ABC transporter permease, partial [Porticoccaceae bacterium]|nr:ABC transporter permease [Porticoccaceae bacterium]